MINYFSKATGCLLFLVFTPYKSPILSRDMMTDKTLSQVNHLLSMGFNEYKTSYFLPSLIYTVILLVIKEYKQVNHLVKKKKDTYMGRSKLPTVP